MDFFSFLIPSFSLPLINDWYYDSNGWLAYKWILSTSDCSFFIKFNNTFAFPDPEPPIIKILINDGQEYKANSDYDLFRVIEHNFSLLL